VASRDWAEARRARLRDSGTGRRSGRGLEHSTSSASASPVGATRYCTKIYVFLCPAKNSNNKEKKALDGCTTSVTVHHCIADQYKKVFMMIVQKCITDFCYGRGGIIEFYCFRYFNK
jgi:hypothetical protein